MTIDAQNIAAVLEIVGLIFGIGAVAWYAIFNNKKDTQKDDDRIAKNLIDNLQKSLDLTDKNLRDTTTRLDQTTKELHIMQGRNEMLERLFNGKENSILSFVQQGAPQLLEMSKSNAKAISDLTLAVENLVAGMSKAAQIEPAPQFGLDRLN